MQLFTRKDRMQYISKQFLNLDYKYNLDHIILMI